MFSFLFSCVHANDCVLGDILLISTLANKNYFLKEMSWLLFDIPKYSGIPNLSQGDFHKTNYFTNSINKTMETYILSPYVLKTKLQLLLPLVFPKPCLKTFSLQSG